MNDLSTTTTRRSLAGINAELLGAVRRTNAEFYALPVDARPELDPRDWRRCEEVIAAATAADDREAALRAIKDWERRARSQVRGTA